MTTSTINANHLIAQALDGVDLGKVVEIFVRGATVFHVAALERAGELGGPRVIASGLQRLTATWCTSHQTRLLRL